MSAIFTIDGREFDVRVLSLKRGFNVLDTENSGRTISSGEMFRDVIGTYYNYEMQLDASRLHPADYDELYEILSSPKESHSVTFPYGYRGTITQEMYITEGSDTLVRQMDGLNKWGGLTVKYVAMKAKRTP